MTATEDDRPHSQADTRPPGAAQVRISVIIPTFNARTTLRCCLLSLLHQRIGAHGSDAGPPFTYEVIVVDDGSSDGTSEMIAQFPSRLDLRYTFLPRTDRSGRARARNAGLALATGGLVVTLDADQVVEPHFLAEHARLHAGGPGRVVAGRRLQLADGPMDEVRLEHGFDPQALPPVVRGDEREQLFRLLDSSLEDMVTGWHHVWTCNASFPRDRLEAVGGFDETFTGWGLEDAELAYRLVQGGATTHFAPSAVVRHEHRTPVTADMYREWCRNLAHFVRRHPAPEVRLQEIFAPAIDPDRSAPGTWDDIAAEFEHTARRLGADPGQHR
ncbi:glycosyltransferase family 2 protein [Streptomyces californicus]|uniref:glycosyltransferase family 2 protein n=1 Tax=Streptomyces TaxID=1883 RepID=UPI00067D5303|nr:glycosyltransferase [Streptomyces sp. SID8369]QRV52996.1 glycosyltransferase [Streptomyces californicus]